jgi:glycerate kinase
MAFFGAEPRRGFDLFCQCARLAERLRQVDLVITGEGAMDRSTLMGKGVGEVARLCRRARVPCLGLAGVMADSEVLAPYFNQRMGLTDLTTAEQAKAEPNRWLEQAARQVGQRI